MTTLELRDHQLLTYVAHFQQLTSSQIHDLVFHESASRHPTYTSLRRLVKRGLLVPLERLRPGGSQGGSGQHVYVLSRQAHRLYGVGGYRRITKERNHSLAIADCYIAALKLEQAGKLKLHEYITEPDSHMKIIEEDLRPDLVLEYERVGGTRVVRLLIEVDMATQGVGKIHPKLKRYKTAYKELQEESDVYVMFVTLHEDRVRWLNRQIRNHYPSDVFRVTTQAGFAHVIGG